MSNLDRPETPNPYDYLPRVAELRLTSDDLTNGSGLKAAQVMSSGNTSPQLTWEPGPSDTQSYVVTCFDPDAPVVSGFWHWVAVDIPSSITSLPTGAGTNDDSLPNGAFHVRNDLNQFAYVGAAPPEGDRVHNYYFAVTAVSESKLGLDRDASPALVGFNLAMKATARGVIRGTFRH